MQTGQQRKARLLKQSRVAELFSVIEYWDEDGIFVFDDNSIGVFMVMHPTSGSNNRTMTGLQNFYKEVYPEKTAVQWSLVSSPDLENMLWGYNDIRGGRSSSEDRDKVEVMAKAGHDFVREGAIEDINQAGYRFRNYEIWLSIRIKIKKALPTEQEITAFTKQVHRLKATLSDFHPRIGDEFDLKRRMNVMLNMYAKRAGWKGNADHLDKCQIDDELRGLFLERGHSIEPYEEGVKCYDDEGKMYQVMRSMTVRQFPDATYYGNVIGLVGQWLDGNIVLNEHYILTLQVFYPNVKKAIKKFNARRAFVNNQARGSVLQWLISCAFKRMTS
ncbi:type IV conjugative transfer system protein TraC (plasmid) [Alteromonas mediterranea 615]|uniref:Type IV conjugative transfer system protein TraC n=1 Tax=Alteromonas mediterranea 615 TaxID=1300253 RepID=S5AKY6_9ALTE|nr:type IV conjugative transfer system protein TraC [Alteromonas mediterranea 615]